MKTEIAQIVTDRIITALEAGTVPWRKPWTAAGINYPTSLSSGKEYRGINVLILDAVAMSEGYEHNLWVTYKQAQSMSGSVLKGQKSTPVVLWKPIERADDDGNIESFMMMRYYNVFNIAQTDLEIPAKYQVERTPVTVTEGINRALNYKSGPTVTHRRQDKAFYNPANDRITLPELNQFTSEADYAQTALHEVAHSTGHPSRLNRLEDFSPFGCEAYAKEELVAEITAAMVASRLGIAVEWEQTAAYVQSWLKALQDDRKMIVSAAQAAQKAMDVILLDDAMEAVA